jgi:hypothetical protein
MRRLILASAIRLVVVAGTQAVRSARQLSNKLTCGRTDAAGGPREVTMHRISTAFLALALWLISGAASADLVANGSFETGDFTSWTQSGNTGFTFVDGTPHSGKYAAWLGPEGSLGYLSQQLTTVAGTQYDLDFWLRHEPFGTGMPNEFDVFWGGVLVDQMTDLGSFPYTEYNVILPAAPAASTELKFGFREDTDYFQLDDVSVQPVPAPEIGTGPGTVILLGSGLIALLAQGKRRRKFWRNEQRR